MQKASAFERGDIFTVTVTGGLSRQSHAMIVDKKEKEKEKKRLDSYNISLPCDYPKIIISSLPQLHMLEPCGRDTTRMLAITV